MNTGLRSMMLLSFVLLFAKAVLGQLPFDTPPINYSKSQPDDPVADLIAKIESGSIVLERDEKTGYLTDLLSHLEIPVSSQTLVFSKTSLQRHLISPSNPRAIYYNDETYVGWVPGGEVIEIASVDPMLGTNFYTIEQFQVRQPIRISRRTERCLFCHASSDTGRVPGLMMQSIYTKSDGNRAFPADSIWPKAGGPLQGRWAGWFVTGKHGKQQHLGNLMVTSDTIIKPGQVSENANVTDLSDWFDTSEFLAPHSDLVALLVLQHQVEMHNHLTDANHRARKLVHAASQKDVSETPGELSVEDQWGLEKIATDLVDALLMVGQLEFSEPVSGTSGFAKEFADGGPSDSSGRSLRQLNLRTQLFEYPCSYLIHSDSFDQLPKPLLDRVAKRMVSVLESSELPERYRHLNGSKRNAILEILRETKPRLFAADR